MRHMRFKIFTQLIFVVVSLVFSFGARAEDPPDPEPRPNVNEDQLKYADASVYVFIDVMRLSQQIERLNQMRVNDQLAPGIMKVWERDLIGLHLAETPYFLLQVVQEARDLGVLSRYPNTHEVALFRELIEQSVRRLERAVLSVGSIEAPLLNQWRTDLRHIMEILSLAEHPSANGNNCSESFSGPEEMPSFRGNLRR